VPSLTVFRPALLGAVAAWVSVHPALAQSDTLARARQVTRSENYDPSLAPDGHSMVYISAVAGREQLMVRSLDGRSLRQLTTDAADHEDPAWSPAGDAIAFVILTGKEARIALIPAAGGTIEVLTPPGERVIHPSWSPDGRRLAYCTDDDLAPPRKNPSVIKVMDLASRRVRVLISGGVNTYPAWSPDGRVMAFRKMLGQSNSEVFIADSAGGHTRNLTNSPAFDGWPAWSPDGRRIAFASNRGGTGDYQIFVMRSDGSDVRLLARSEGRATSPKWSRDGRTVYFPLCRDEEDGGGCEIFAAAVPAA
jgi:TolB protein